MEAQKLRAWVPSAQQWQDLEATWMAWMDRPSQPIFFFIGLMIFFFKDKD